MNVLFVCHIANRYGANRSLFELILALKPLGVNPSVVLPREDEFCNDLKKTNIDYSILPVSWWVAPVPALNRYSSPDDVNEANLPPELIEWARSKKPDLIHTNASVTPDGYLLARHLQVPHIWHLREMCEEHYGFEWTAGKEKVLECFQKSTRCIANSEAVRKAYFGDTAPEQVNIVANPVAAPSSFAPRADGFPNKLRLTSIGHMSESKGHHSAILAVAELKKRGVDCSLKVIGGGENPYRERCDALIAENDLSGDIQMIPEVDGPWGTLAETDILLQCSQHEAFGRVTVEAMLSGAIVVGLNSGGTPEIITHEKTGFLFSDPKEIPDLIESLRSSDSIQSIRTNALQEASKTYNTDGIAQKVLECFRKTL